MISAKKLAEILQQFPDDMPVEFGLLDPENLNELIVLPIGDILISDKHLMIVDEKTLELTRRAQVQRTLGSESQRQGGPEGPAH